MKLTDRHRHAAHLILAGKTNRAIADQMQINRSTIAGWRALPEFQVMLDKQREDIDERVMDTLTDLKDDPVENGRQYVKRHIPALLRRLVRIGEKGSNIPQALKAITLGCQGSGAVAPAGGVQVQTTINLDESIMRAVKGESEFRGTLKDVPGPPEAIEGEFTVDAPCPISQATAPN